MSILLSKEDKEYINQICGDNSYSWLSLSYRPIRYNKSQWGFEAKNGYSYLIGMNFIICPKCLRKIDCRNVRHNLNEDDEWDNGCAYCSPEWDIAEN